MTVILDACAIIAFLRDEEGAEQVESAFLQADCVAHAINLCEVYKDCLVRGEGRAQADQLLSDLASIGLRSREDIDADLWKHAAELKADVRRISYADCFALALTHRLQGVLYSCDHHELDTIANRGIYSIKFIR
jgi:PIN domain nuclease of toxin-antitoxin system